MAVETITIRGQSWTRIPARSLDRFTVGVDLGQSVDATAICVLHHTITPLDDSEWSVDQERHVITQPTETRFDVRHLERLPLATPYPEQVSAIADILSRPPLRGAALVLDATGCGAPVADLFDQAGLDPVKIIISAGFGAEYKGKNRWTVPKPEIISRLDAGLHTGELRFAAALREAGAMADELKDFRRHVGAAGRATYNARTGKHDDLVLAVGIALWAATRPSRGEFSQGMVEGLY